MKEGQNFDVFILLLLRIGTVCVFLGRGIQLIFWSSPYSVFFWDESLLEPLVNILGGNWSEYLSEVANGRHLGLLAKFNGFSLILAAISALWYPRLGKVGKWLIYFGVFHLFILTLLYWKDHFWIWAQLIEYTLQWSLPLFFLQAFKGYHKNFSVCLKIAIAFTFLGHGAFALGWFPIPGSFYGMVIKILQVDQGTAEWILWIAGVLDLIIILAIFIPFRYSKPIITYAVFWGLATTLARIVSHFYLDDLSYTFLKWGPETLFRFPHFIGPMVLFLILWKKEKDKIYSA